MKASMDGSGVGTVVLLNNVNVIHTFVFTYSQQILYWMNSSDSCYYTNYIESSKDGGSGGTITYDPSSSSNIYFSNDCCYDCYRQTQAIDFFEGDIYSYSGHNHDIVKTIVDYKELKITDFPYVSNYMCQSSYVYSGMKVISPKRQPQGICIMHC